MANRVRRYRVLLTNVQEATRRDVLLGLAAALGLVAHLEPALARRGRVHKERKRLRKQCKRTCKHVHRDCLSVCRGLGNPDDICHPQCSAARHSCRRGCR